MARPSSHHLAVRMAELARHLASPRPAEAVLTDVTAAARELIPGVDTAGILLVGKGGAYDSLAGTSELPHELDELQMRFNEGPCVEAALNETIVRTDDFRTEPRWPQYSPAVVDLGVLSGLSFKLYTADRTAGRSTSSVSEPTPGPPNRKPSAPCSPPTPRPPSSPANTTSRCKQPCPHATASAKPKASSWNATTSTTSPPSTCSDACPRKPTSSSPTSLNK